MDETHLRSAMASLEAAQGLFSELGCGAVMSLCGRYYAMTGTTIGTAKPERTICWRAAKRPFTPSATAALQAAYDRDENDEFVQPTAIHSKQEPPRGIKAEDGVIFMNFRADRARQLTRAMTEEDFSGFERRSYIPAHFVTLTQYADDIDVPCAFVRKPCTTLGEFLQNNGKRQLRIAETEKYAHVTFLFLWRREQPFDGEKRILIPSPDVATYDLQPQMSAAKVTDQLREAIHSGEFDVIVCNYANGDMVGHSGKLQPAIQAVETLDTCMARLEEAITAVGGNMLITADHGNVELMRDPTSNQEHTAHTSNLVPLVYVGDQPVQLKSGGSLCDVAPTLLDLMQMDAPDEMTGKYRQITPA